MGCRPSGHTMKSIESKHAELNEAERFRAAVKTSRRKPPATTTTAPMSSNGIRSGTLQCPGRLQAPSFRTPSSTTAIRTTGSRRMESPRRSSDGFDKLEQAVREAATSRRVPLGRQLSPFMEDPAVRQGFRVPGDHSDDLREAINHDLARRSQDTREHFRTSLWIVFSISALACSCCVWPAPFFYGWVFYPIRDLQEGAGRVAQGDFDHRIEVHSGDEMEDLAEAFNDMTGRLREMYRDLARQVNERSRQLVRSERLAGVGFLAAGVAHEINNPLPSIAFCSEALEQRLAMLLWPGLPDDERSRRQVSQDDPGGSLPLQGDHPASAGIQPRRRAPPRADRPG